VPNHIRPGPHGQSNASCLRRICNAGDKRPSSLPPSPSTHHRLIAVLIFSHNDPIPPLSQRPHSSSTRDMTDQQRPARFHVLLESALQAYEKRAGVMLADLGHAPAAQLQNCHTVDDITAVLQSQTQAVGDLRQRGRIFESIKATVSTLTPTSSVAYVADDVSQKTLMDPLTSDHFSRRCSHMGRQYTLLLASYWRYVPLSSSYLDVLLTPKPTRQLTA